MTEQELEAMSVDLHNSRRYAHINEPYARPVQEFSSDTDELVGYRLTVCSRKKPGVIRALGPKCSNLAASWQEALNMVKSE